MKALRLLDEADLSCLEGLLDSNSLPRLGGEQKTALARMLAETAVSRDPVELESRVGISDRITLVSAMDSSDWYKPEIVMPQEEDLDTDRISTLTPVGLAALGRGIGDRISWQTPAGERVMEITGILKRQPCRGA